MVALCGYYYTKLLNSTSTKLPKTFHYLSLGQHLYDLHFPLSNCYSFVIQGFILFIFQFLNLFCFCFLHITEIFLIFFLFFSDLFHLTDTLQFHPHCRQLKNFIFLESHKIPLYTYTHIPQFLYPFICGIFGLLLYPILVTVQLL